MLGLPKYMEFTKIEGERFMLDIREIKGFSEIHYTEKNSNTGEKMRKMGTHIVMIDGNGSIDVIDDYEGIKERLGDLYVAR